MNNSLKLYKSFFKANKLFFEIVVPKLPEHVRNELMQPENEYFTISCEGKENKWMLNLSKNKYDITDVYQPGITIFDVYEH